MKKQGSLYKRIFSVFLVFIMAFTMIPAISLMFGEKLTAHAYGTYTKQKNNEYYYSSTTKFFYPALLYIRR